jgi:hypothetical protein
VPSPGGISSINLLIILYLGLRGAFIFGISLSTIRLYYFSFITGITTHKTRCILTIALNIRLLAIYLKLFHRANLRDNFFLI